LASYYRATADPTPYRIGDLSTDTNWRATTAYRYQFAKCGISRELVIPLPSPLGRLRVVAIGRSGPEFTLRDRAYARHAQPLLRHLDALTRHHTPSPSDILTPRESAVLALLAAGHTAQAIARRLHVSPRTVHAHLRSLYRKLGTTDRLSTVLHARETGLLNPH
jgi:DNA-binding CsgD family transcriptional regulator